MYSYNFKIKIMKNLIQFSSGILVFLLLFSVSCTDSSPVGIWEDNIKLSEKEVEVSGQFNSILITTQGAGWWLSGIRVNDSYIDINSTNTVLSDFIIETTDFKIERKNTTEIHIDIFENTTDSVRILDIGLQSGDYFDNIIIKQMSN